MRGLGKRREAVRVVELGRVRPTARPPAATTPSPAVPPCAATWSTCPRASPPRPANLSCTCPPTGPGGPHGRPCGTTSSATQPRNPAPPDPTGPCPPRYPRPDPSNPQQGKAGAGQQIMHAPGASTPDRVSPKTADDRSKSPIRRVARGNRTPGLPQIRLCGIPHNGIYVPRMVMLKTGCWVPVFPCCVGVSQIGRFT